MIDRDQLDHLLHDVARDRAGREVTPPDDGVLHGLRARGRARRRRRSRRAVVAVAAVALAGVVMLARMPGAGHGTDRVDTVDESSTTSSSVTTSTSTTAGTGGSSSTSSGTTGGSAATGPAGGPAIGAPARAYIGVTVLTRENDRRLWTEDGRSLGYLRSGGHQAVGDAATVLEVGDGERTMLWLLDSSSPDHGTIIDAVNLPATASGTGGAGLGTGCTVTTTTEADVVGAVVGTSPAGQSLTVVAAWTIRGAAGEMSFDPLPAAEVRCAGWATAG